MQKAIDRGPVALAMNGECDAVVHYKGGIIDSKDCDPNRITHSVVAVGYGRENGKAYITVKNSWGKEWGEEGYGRIAINSHHFNDR